jgi:hypothetical protein
MKRIPGAFLVRQTFFHGGETAFVPSSFISFNQAPPIQQSFSSLLTSSSSSSELQLQSQLQFTDSATATATTVLTEQTKTFEAVAPDTNILIGFGIVFILSIIASYVWAEEVVPVSRTKLALSKKNGEVNQYLQELKQGSINTSINADADADVQDGTTTATSTNMNTIKPNVGDGRDLERWLFSDWLNDNKSARGGRKKEPAIPILKKAKWNSGDNPVVVTAAIMMVGIIIASVTERVGTNGL